MKHFSLDLETLGTAPSSVVVSLGMCYFDKSGIGETISFACPIQEQLDRGRTVTKGTLDFWFEQDRAVREAVFKNPVQVPLSMVPSLLKARIDSITQGEEFRVWVKGMNFDPPIIEDICRQEGCDSPVPYWAWRDVRTLTDLVKKPPRDEEELPLHSAIHDAIYQANCIINCWEKLNA